MRCPFLVTNPTKERITSMYIPPRRGLSTTISACLVFLSPVASSALPREAREKGTPLDRTTVGRSHRLLPRASAPKRLVEPGASAVSARGDSNHGPGLGRPTDGGDKMICPIRILQHAATKVRQGEATPQKTPKLALDSGAVPPRAEAAE